MNAELDQLRAALDGLRAGVLKKLAGLSDEDARRSTVGSGTNIAGLDPAVSLRTLRAGYLACEASNEIIAAIGDPAAPVTRDGKTRNLRSVLVGMIEETARHAGHADIIREQVDGKTGR